MILKIVFLFFLAADALDIHPRTKTKGPAQLADRENIDYWMEKGMEELNKAKETKPNENLAKNIILFVGDGMSLPTVSAARIFKGQFFSESDKHVGETEGNSAKLSWENFPHMGLSKTYSVSSMVPDSASTASAMFSGIKTVSWTMGFDSHVVDGDPSSVANATAVKTILDWAQEAGMATGFITNTRATHATPGALYAKSADRDWECDSEMPSDAKDLKDIARQMMENNPGKDTDIILGGGLAPFVNYDLIDEEQKTRFDYALEYWNCHRDDNRNLLDEWQAEHTNGAIIFNKTQLLSDTLLEADKVRGFFAWTYMPYEDQLNASSSAPTLEEMTRAAVQFLESKGGDKGYFLMVEGGKIDHAHHGSEASRALRETIGLDRAVASAVDLVNTEETLIMVTADHSHTLAIGGYNDRFADITREVQQPGHSASHASDGDRYTIMTYGNGAGFKENQAEVDEDYELYIQRGPVPEESLDYEYKFPSSAPLSSETHGGDDVGIWAIGPMSHYFHSVHEQSYIAHVMSYAACVGPHSNQERCTAGRDGWSSK